MTPASLREYARDVAFVTFSMLEALDAYDEDQLPGGYLYHLFGGFMGFCDHAGAAGLVLAKVFDGFIVDDWVEIADDYAHRVIAHAVQTQSPASGKALKTIAARATQGITSARGAP